MIQIPCFSSGSCGDTDHGDSAPVGVPPTGDDLKCTLFMIQIAHFLVYLKRVLNPFWHCHLNDIVCKKNSML